MAYPPAYPHDPIEEIGSDLFMVRGGIKMNPLVSITRNMAIVRHEGELSLVNPVRLDEAGEASLRELGTVKRLLRLGPMHGLDDPYYIDTFHAELWAPGDSESYPEPKPDHLLTSDAELPFPNAELFCFDGTKQPETMLLMKQGSGVLLTCDAIQHYGDYEHINFLGRIAMPLLGFAKTTLIGPIWLKKMVPEGISFESEFRRILDLEFDQLLSAHGSFLASGARAAVERAIEKAFPG